MQSVSKDSPRGLRRFVPYKWARRVIRTLLCIVFLFLLLFGYLAYVARMTPPSVDEQAYAGKERTAVGASFYYLGNNWFRKSNSGLYELYVEGKPFERGLMNGKLAKELVVHQEDVFAAQISKMIPSKFYRNFLRYFVGWFNRDLDKNVPEEYLEEIYGVSRSASADYDYIGSNYERIMNYHAAHNIGHALQNMMLVGCTSFGTWDDQSENGDLIIGRNFDFWVGDDFAEQKMVDFIHPDKGIPFMMVGWGGFVGVVSGMNLEGLTVTLNADKSDIPTGSATPISLVGREILQYASNIEEAINIAKTRKTFVSESILIDSAKDHRAVIIEKTPDSLAVYDPHQHSIVCANHYQSAAFLQEKNNKVQMEESASMYRYKRVVELLGTQGKNTVVKTAALLRDRAGLNNANIGNGNEKAVNQLISHHSIIFEPEKRLVWVSTAPWQLGQYVAYDLNKVFQLAGLKEDKEIRDTTLTIPADPFLQTADYQNFVKFRAFKEAIHEEKDINVDSLIQTNPLYYHTWVLAGDYCFKQKDYTQAKTYYDKALTLEIATVPERKKIESQRAKCVQK